MSDSDEEAPQETQEETHEEEEEDVLPELWSQLEIQGCPLLPRPLFLLEIEARECAQRKDIPQVVEQSVEKGLANAVLLRDGDLNSTAMMNIAQGLYPLCTELGVKFLVEDRIDIVAANQADGILFNGMDANLAKMIIAGIDKEKERKEKMMEGEGDMKRNAVDVYDIDDDQEQVEEEEEEEEEKGGENCRVLTGCLVNSVAEAKEATKQNHDFVLIDGRDDFTNGNGVGEGDGEGEGEYQKISSDQSGNQRSPVLTLQDIRKALSSHMILTSKFCRAVGGPKASFNWGADGIQIPVLEARRLLDCIVGIETAKLPKSGRVLGAILLIAGSTVGAGIIAMPVKTAAAGFIPTIFTMTGAWLFMVLTSMLIVEVSLWYGPEVNLLSMTQNTLGIGGRTISMCLYLFIYTATLTAYLSEGSAMCMPLLSKLIGKQIPSWLGTSIFAGVSGLALYSGPKRIDLLNRACVYAALYSFVQLIVRCSSSLEPTLLARANWQVTTTCIPIMVVAFTFHNIVPSLVGYLGSPKAVLKAILIGSFIPYFLYIIWQAIILGTLPENLVYTLKSGTDVVTAIGGVASDKVSMHVSIFSFFAIVTSLLGIGMGCVDFVKDALPNSVSAKKTAGNLSSLFLTLAPPLAISILAPGAFYAALEFSGTFRLILFGIVPALMVWSGRRKGELAWLPVGALPLALVIAAAVAVIGMELWMKTNIKLFLLPPLKSLFFISK